MSEEECEGFLKSEEFIRTDNGLQARFSYHPTLKHSERFADLTGDKNQIHRELYDGETVVPAFLQNVMAILASKRAMSEYGINPSDFPISSNKISLDNFVISGLEYILLLTLKEKPLGIDVEITDLKGKKVFGMNRGFEEVRTLEDYQGVIHSESFEIDGQTLSEFSRIIGAVSSESNLYVIASSSSVIYRAYDAGKLPKIEKGIVPIYSGQEVYLNSTKSIHGVVDVLLSLSELPKGLLKRGDKLKTMISTWYKGNLVNRIASEVTFQNEKLPELAVKRGLRDKKK
ncbi:MAG: hypothetical protein QXF25_01900 [Candidatus Pacearchaeota archaeon]